MGEVTAAAASTITNTATVSGDQPEADPADATSSVTTTVLRPHDAEQVFLYSVRALTCHFPGRIRDNTFMQTHAVAFYYWFYFSPAGFGVGGGV